LYAAGVTAFLVTASAVHAAPDEEQLLSLLQPQQRANVTVVSRQGVRRTVADTPPPAISAVALTTPDAMETEASTPGPSSQIAAPTPTPEPRPAPAPAFVAAQERRDTFVPTETVERPEEHPTPQAQTRDLPWLYAHRFETPPPGQYFIPGLPVRSQVGSPFDVRSGAFHGVRSVNGWSALRVAVSIPCGVSRFALGPGHNEASGRDGLVDQETGYIYVGGWGAGSRGTPVDAGLQKSSAQAAFDAYAVYWKYAGNGPVTSIERFRCGGPDVVLQFYPVNDGMLVFSATGEVKRGRKETITVVQETRRDDGWTPSGGSARDGIILKRLVSIAQPSSWRGAGHATRFTNGSYFGVDSATARTPRIVWQDCEIGRVYPPRIVPTYRPWTNALNWYPDASGTYLDWPPFGVVRSVDGVCDAAGITLRNG
jgi:hypothetical protein